MFFSKSHQSSQLLKIHVLLFLGVSTIPPIMADVLVLRASLGQDARLPCGQGKVFLDGPDSYVVWLKEDKDFLYRFPEDESIKRFVNPNNVYGTICKDGVCFDETSLMVRNVTLSDSGLYTCRVHYQGSPTDEFIVAVRVVSPPGKPHITTKSGIEPSEMDSIFKGSNVTLICNSPDGADDVVLSWTKNGEVLKSEVTYGERSLALTITNVTRDDHQSKYECQAKHDDVSAPLTEEFILLVILEPTNISLTNLENPYLANMVDKTVECIVEGSNPAAVVTWSLGNETFDRLDYDTEYVQGRTISTLTFKPYFEDDSMSLMCKAENFVAHSTIETHKTIFVGNTPKCADPISQIIGVMPDETEITKCTVESEDPPCCFKWYFRGSPVPIKGSDKLPVSRINSTHLYSTELKWRPDNTDSKVLACSSSNRYGEQVEPCNYSITAGGTPAMPLCILERTSYDLRAKCTPGWDGGRPQTFYMEVEDHMGKLICNMSNTDGNFKLDVPNDNNLTVVTYSGNTRGRSLVLAETLTPVREEVVGLTTVTHTIRSTHQPKVHIVPKPSEDDPNKIFVLKFFLYAAGFLLGGGAVICGCNMYLKFSNTRNRPPPPDVTFRRGSTTSALFLDSEDPSPTDSGLTQVALPPLVFGASARLPLPAPPGRTPALVPMVPFRFNVVPSSPRRVTTPMPTTRRMRQSRTPSPARINQNTPSPARNHRELPHSATVNQEDLPPMIIIPEDRATSPRQLSASLRDHPSANTDCAASYFV